MIGVLGIEGQVGSTQDRWSSKTAPVIYADKTTRRCWFWLPPDVGNDDYVAIRFDSGIQRVDIGHLQPNSTDGRFTYFVLEQHQFASLEASKDFESISKRPTLFPTIKQERTAHDLVQNAQEGMHALRLVAWFASGLATLGHGALKDALGAITVDELFGAHDQSRRAVRRDERLFKELIDAIELRRLVFVLGGRKSGVSEFLDQFKDVLPKQKPNGTHLTAAFNGATFGDIYDFIKDGALLKGLTCEPDITSVFITLAYAAYVGLLGSDTTDQDSLASFIPAIASEHPEQFVVKYISKLSLITSAAVQVEAFIQFIRDMMKAAGRADTLTVILSISGFADWLREKRARENVGDIERSLWKALKSFTLSNYDGKGEPKPKSMMYKFADSIGIVVEIHRLAVAELAEGFCKHSVLIIPPYNDDELARLWTQYLDMAPTEDVLQYLREQTRGAPWFVQLLLQCTEAASGATPMARLEAAGTNARAILNGASVVPASGALESVKTSWETYLKDLHERLSAAARLDRNTLALLSDASAKPVTNYAHSHLPDWLESGLIWVRPERDVHSLSAFANYPIIRTWPRGALLNDVIGSLTSPPALEKAS